MSNATPDLSQALLEILSARKVRRQEDLVRILAEKGIHTDQSVLSRTLTRLGIQKRSGFYHYAVESSRPGLKINPLPPNFIVVKTLPGHAQALAFKLDGQSVRGLAGTIAGDDTVLCIIEGQKWITAVANHLAQMT